MLQVGWLGGLSGMGLHLRVFAVEDGEDQVLLIAKLSRIIYGRPAKNGLLHSTGDMTHLSNRLAQVSLKGFAPTRFTVLFQAIQIIGPIEIVCSVVLVIQLGGINLSKQQ